MMLIEVSMTNIFLRIQNGVKLFSGNADRLEVFNTTVSLAENCAAFQMDVEDEIVYENQTTCYNCRYRRWNSDGFSCYKDFPGIK
jgi:hypothetical protein